MDFVAAAAGSFRSVDVIEESCFAGFAIDINECRRSARRSRGGRWATGAAAAEEAANPPHSARRLAVNDETERNLCGWPGVVNVGGECIAKIVLGGVKARSAVALNLDAIAQQRIGRLPGNARRKTAGSGVFTHRLGTFLALRSIGEGAIEQRDFSNGGWIFFFNLHSQRLLGRCIFRNRSDDFDRRRERRAKGGIFLALRATPPWQFARQGGGSPIFGDLTRSGGTNSL